jgi:hypothetical protein
MRDCFGSDDDCTLRNWGLRGDFLEARASTRRPTARELCIMVVDWLGRPRGWRRCRGLLVGRGSGGKTSAFFGRVNLLLQPPSDRTDQLFPPRHSLLSTSLSGPAISVSCIHPWRLSIPVLVLIEVASRHDELHCPTRSLDPYPPEGRLPSSIDVHADSLAQVASPNVSPSGPALPAHCATDNR